LPACPLPPRARHTVLVVAVLASALAAAHLVKEKKKNELE
jgi:hypothetical protein